MNTVTYIPNFDIVPQVRQTLHDARVHVLGTRPLFMAEGGEGDFDFRWNQIKDNPAAFRILGARIKDYLGDPNPSIPEKTLFLDIESHNAEKVWDMPRDEFVRLVQWGWGWDGEIHVSSNLHDLMEQIEEADLIIAHNGHQFDFLALLGDISLEMSMENKLFDTFVHANIAVPAPYSYQNRNGQWMFDTSKPGPAMKWLSLDNLCYQFGVGGKEGDLKALAKKHNPPKTLMKDLDFSLIPLDDPEFLAYADQDIVSLRDVTRMILWAHPLNAYAVREQHFAAINAQMSRNGWRVDIPVAQARADALAERKAELMDKLVNEYGLPREGKQPWRSKLGKEAIFKILSDNGITPQTRPHWEKTATGNLSLGGKVLIEITEGSEIEDLGQGLAELMGQRSLAELALDSVKSDGRVHPSVTSLQRSGRSSLTEPGLTVWSDKADGGVDKIYFLPDDEDHVLVSVDFSNADARAVAAYSGDKEFAKRFEVDENGEDLYDGHDESGVALFGREEYYSVLNEDGGSVLRELAKLAGHAQNYNVGATTLSNGLNKRTRALGMDREFSVPEGYELITNFGRAFPDLKKWKDDMYRMAESGWIVNEWGRAMPIDPGRAFTQGPALMGQSATREILVDGLLRLYKNAKWMIRSLKATVHDEAVFSVPRERYEEASRAIHENMEYTFFPSGGQSIHFSVNISKPANNWKEA